MGYNICHFAHRRRPQFYAHVMILRPSFRVDASLPGHLSRLVLMDFDFRCNRLSCRKSLTDKAVVVSNPLMSLTWTWSPFTFNHYLRRHVRLMGIFSQAETR